MLEERHTPEELAKVHEQLWQCVLQFGNITAMQERNRIARDLHDSLGHALTALNIQLQTAVTLWQLNPEKAQRFLAEAVRLGSVATNEVRQSVKLLRDPAPETECLQKLIESLVADFHQSTGILPSTQINLPIVLPQEVTTPVYRIIQEAINNICKYAKAEKVEIQLIANLNTLYIHIQDNGRGFKPSEAHFGFGIQGMRERVAILRGQFCLNSAPGAGCKISIEIPLQPLPLVEQQPQLIKSNTPVLAPAEFKSNSLSVEQNTYLEQTLIELFGPIAPKLIQQVLTGAKDLEGLIEDLACYLSSEEQIKFKQQIAIIQGEAAQLPLIETNISVLTPVKFQPILSVEQISYLEQILMESLGPIATKLVKQVGAGAKNTEGLIEDLACYLPSEEQLKFKQQAAIILEKKAQPNISTSSTNQTMPQKHQSANAESFVKRCEQELSDLVGPIAPLLVQKILIASPHISNEELVEALAKQIPDTQEAMRFQRRLLA